MGEPIITSLGRVQPIYKGEYVHGVRYELLDNVFYQGSTYISIVDNNLNHYPTDSNYWQLVASKGAEGKQGHTGSFGQPTATATLLDTGDNPTVSVNTSGPDEGKIFNFNFGIPAGPYGFDEVTAHATTLASDQQITVEATLDKSSDTRTLNFNFGIPAADGQGAQSVDNINADANNNISLSAIRYVNQNLSNVQKTIACNNINAIENPLNKFYGSFLYYGGDRDAPTWITESITGISNTDIDTIFGI